MIRNFLSKLKWIPGTIKGQQGPVSYEIELDDGRVMRRHVDHIISNLDSHPQDPSPEIISEFEYPELPSSPQIDQGASPPIHRYPLRNRRPPERLMEVHILRGKEM